LDKARHDEEVPTASESEGHAAAPMPKFLQGQEPEVAEHNAAEDAEQPERWREKLDLMSRILSGRERAQWIFLGATVAASAALLLGLEHVDLAGARSQRPATVIADVAPAPPEVRLNFVGEMRCDQPPCDGLSTAIPRTIATLPVKAAESASPGLVYATHSDLTVEDQTALKPLDKVTVTGLPPNVRLSVGQKTSDTEWTLAAGDLNDIRIIVPDEQVEPVKATIEIKRSAGEPIAAIGLTIEREAPAGPSFADPLMSMAPIDPLPADEDDKAEPVSSAAREPETAPAKPAKAPKVVKVRQKKTKQPAPVVQQQAAETPKPPATLLEGLLAPATKQAAAPVPESTPKTSFTGDGANPSFPPPSTTIANEPAGFETLRGLGGGFGLQPQ
jgi:hypothetical protein